MLTTPLLADNITATTHLITIYELIGRCKAERGSPNAIADIGHRIALSAGATHNHKELLAIDGLILQS